MIISFRAGNELHGVHVILQQGLTQIRATGLCKAEGDAGGGVYQVPDWVFDGQRAKYGDIPVCAKCVAVLHKMKEPPK